MIATFITWEVKVWNVTTEKFHTNFIQNQWSNLDHCCKYENSDNVDVNLIKWSSRIFICIIIIRNIGFWFFYVLYFFILASISFSFNICCILLHKYKVKYNVQPKESLKTLLYLFQIFYFCEYPGLRIFKRVMVFI